MEESGGVKLLDWDQRGRPDTIALHQGSKIGNRGVDAWIQTGYELGTVLLHYGEDEAGRNLPFFSPVGSPGATEPAS